MTFGHYLVGSVLGLASLGAVLAAALRVRARLLPAWTGAPARVAEGILSAGMLVIALQCVGVVGALDQLGAVAGCVTVGLLGWVLAGRAGSRRAASEQPPAVAAPAQSAAPAHDAAGRSSRWPSGLTIIALAAASASWTAWVLFAYGHGMNTVDTVWYHLPSAARFVQTGSILHLHYLDRDPVTAFYPANAELFHAFGLLLFHNDLVSPAINLVWAGLAIAAAWAIGRPFERQAHCTTAVALILATPALVDTQPGGAYNDIVCIALLLAAAAMLVNGGVHGPACALAAVATGLALGTKFTMIAPALALAVGVVAISRRGTRARQAGLWGAALAIFGGYWYLRNAALVGNPVPPLALNLGPIALPAPHVSTPTFTVGQYLTDGNIWRSFFIPGFRRALGPAWAAIVALAAAGALATMLVGRDAGHRNVRLLLGAVAILSGGAFLVAPQFLGLPGAPIFFVDNVRYGTAPVALGLVLLPTLPWFDSAKLSAALLSAFAAVLLATELDPGVWPTGVGLKPFAPPVHGASALAGGLLGGAVLLLGLACVRWRVWQRVVVFRARLRSRPAAPNWLLSRAAAPTLAATAVALATFTAGWGIAEHYADTRYSDAPPFPAIYRWSQHLRKARIGIVGLVEQYPLYGADSSNYVQYVGAAQPHRGFGAISSCHAWRQAVDSGHYGWLVVAPYGFQVSTSRRVAPEIAWTSSSPAARAVLSERPVGSHSGDVAVLFVLKAPLDASSCA